MGNLADFRAQYPGAYDHVDDQQLADAIYNKFYAPRNVDRREFDARIGLTPYQNVLEATGTAISNLPQRWQMGVTGIERAGAEMANAEINQFFDRLGADFTLSERPEVQEVNFIQWARQQLGQEGLPPEQERAMIQSMGRDPAMIAQYQQAITEGAMIGPGAREVAENVVGAQLRMRQLEAEQTPIDVASGSPEAYLSGAIGAVAEMAPALGASVVMRNPIPAMVWAGAQSGGIAYDEAREAGLEPEQARQYGALYAAAEGIPEALPVGVVLNRLRQAGGGQFAFALGEAAVSEAVQEGFTEGLQALIDQQFIDPDLSWGEAWERIKDASITGAIAGPAMVGVARGTDVGLQGAGRAAQEAAAVSQQVLGGVQQGAQNLFDATWTNLEETAARVRGLPLEEQVEAFAREQYIQPESAQRNTMQVDASGQPVTEQTQPASSLPRVTYTNQNAQRSLPLARGLESAIQQSVAQVFGPGYTIEVMSGGQGEGSAGQVGSRRHDHGNAGDVWIVGPDGNRVQGDALIPLAEHWLSQGYGSVGFPSNNQSLHLDLIGGEVEMQSGEGRFWFYGDATPAQRQALERASAGAPSRGLSIVDRIIMAESSGGPSARNPDSSAGGLGQFTDSTWLEAARRHGGDAVRGLSDAQVLALKTDGSPEGIRLQRQVLEGFTDQQATALSNAGIETTPGNIYAAHFLGIGGARAVLLAPDNASVAEIVGQQVVDANPFLANMTVADFKRWAAQKMETGSASAGGPMPRGAASAGGGATPAQPRASTAVEQPATQADGQTARTDEIAPPVQQPASEIATMEPFTVRTPTGQQIEARAEIVDLNDLQSAQGELQPRDRSRAASTAQIEDIAINLDPSRLIPSTEADRGAPIVGPDGVVESGNGRLEALRRVYDAYPEQAERYRQMLREQGFDIPDGGMPVLVSRRQTELTPEERRTFVEGANTSAIARMAPAEIAANDARLIDASILSTIEPGARMTPASIASPANPFTRAFIDRLPQAERSSLVDRDGRLNAEGVRRVQNALMAAAYGDPALVERFSEAVDDNTKAITGALADVAADWASLQAEFADGTLDAAYNLTPHLNEALSVLQRARDLAAQQGRPVRAMINEALGQMDMLGGGITPEAAEFIKAFYTPDFGRAKSRDHVATFLRNVIADTRSAAQPQMFGDQVQPGEIVDAAARRTEREADRGQGDLLASRRPGERAPQDGQRDGEPAVQDAGASPPGALEVAKPGRLTNAEHDAIEAMIEQEVRAASPLSREDQAQIDRSYSDNSPSTPEVSRLIERGLVPAPRDIVVYRGTTRLEPGADEFLSYSLSYNTALGFAGGRIEGVRREVVPAGTPIYSPRSGISGGEVLVRARDLRAPETLDARTAPSRQGGAASSSIGRFSQEGYRGDYPIAPRSEWYSDGTYRESGGVMTEMSPENYLSRVRPLRMDEETRENIDILKEHIEGGGTLDPLKIYADGKEDGRHRAHAAQELGIPTVPVIVFDGGTVSEPTTLGQLDRLLDQVQYRPGPKHVATFGAAGMPTRPANNKVQVTGGNLTLPKKETKRDEPRKKLLSVVGDRIYFGRVRGKKRLGFYRPGNSEIRVKGYDDVEVLAHEAAHYLDFDKRFEGRFTAFRRGHAGELDALSYTTDPALVNIEGFAEFVRLWSTNYAMAQQLAPQATVNFETQLKRELLLGKMKAFQQAAHRWYHQGTMAQFLGKSGSSDKFIDTFNAFLRSRPGQRFITGFVDSKYAAKVIEREATGTVSNASNSAWKLYRMTAGGASMAEAVIVDGTPQLMPDGSYGFRGKSLADVFSPVTKKGGVERFDALMAYFKARRARELMLQGREKLFTRAEISAGLDLAKTYPEFEQVFADFQQFNSEMLDFYVDMGLLTPETREAFARNNTEYVPFHRVLDVVGVDGKGGGSPSNINRRLLGGEQNTREIIDNIVDGVSANVQAALLARAKAKLFETIQRSQEGSEFAVRIPAGSKPIKVALEQYKSRFAEILVNLGYEVEVAGQVVTPQGQPALNQGQPINADDVEALLEQHPELLQFWLHNQKPNATETHIEPAIIDGELQWFEVQSPLLMSLLAAPRKAPPLLKAVSIPKRFLTSAITTMPQFMAPNLVRDTVNAGALTQSKFRPFVESGRGLRSYLTKSDAFKLFRLNGGLFSGRIDEGVAFGLSGDRKKWQVGAPAANMFDQIGRNLARTTRIAAPFEQATRIGQFERAMQAGIDPLEAAFQGREISTDFAQMGRNEAWRWFLQTVPFANAGLQGIDQMLRHLMEADGKIRPNLKSASKLGVQAFTKAGIGITVSSIILWALNQDDERYQALTTDEKARFWHIWLPEPVGHVQIPKPYGVGFIFADIPEIALDFVKSRDGEQAAQQLAFAMAQHFWFLDTPGIISPMLEAMSNKKFTGAPIIPQSLQGVDAEYQYTDRTPEVYRALGKTLGVSPLLAEHYVKSFLGYTEALLVDATEWFLWDGEAWGERPNGRDVFDYFTWQFNGRETPYRTRWTEGYYDLRQRASGKAATYNHLFRMGLRDLSDFTDFTQNEVNLMLRELNTLFNRIDSSMSNADAMLMAIKYNPELSREEKERQTDAWYAQRNEQLGTAYQQANEIVQRMERDLDR